MQELRTLRSKRKEPIRVVREDSSIERDSNKVIETLASTIKNKKIDLAKELESKKYLIY
jgi:hypothetical protein